jgi:lycopene cyclase domain-containing protein
MAEYTLLTVVAIVVVVVLDLVVVRTRVLTTLAFWLSLAIMLAFQIPVDGWLTRLDAPIVRYADEYFSGIRVFFDSPVEDFGFGFAMVVATLMTWSALGPRSGVVASDGRCDERPHASSSDEPGDGTAAPR